MSLADLVSVTSTGSTRTTTGLYLVFPVPNGTYSYPDAPPFDLASPPAGGPLTVGPRGSRSVGLGTPYVDAAFGPAGSPPATSLPSLAAVARVQRG